MLKTDYFKDKIKTDFEKNGSKIYVENAKYIIDELQVNHKTVKPVNIGDLEKGKFYVLFYDLSGKTSKMEKINPMLLCDWADMNNTRFVFGCSLNFIPVSIRVVFFNNLLNNNLNILSKNETLDIGDQRALDQINFANVYKLLQSIGYEWSIRKLDAKKLNKAHVIDTKVLDKFITMSTASLTGVDDGKLMEIWLKKLKEQDERHKKLLVELAGDYTKISNELNTQFSKLNDREQSLQESLNMMKNIK